MSVRVYPTRFTRKRWRIALYCLHKCTQSCNYILVREKRKSKYILQEVEENNCDRESNIENTIISIKDFDIANPNSLMGQLYGANNIVIPQNRFTMDIKFPLRRHAKIVVNEPLGNGFMLKEILYAIKMAYEDIYNLEEQTSSQNQYIFMTTCEECYTIELKKCIVHLTEDDNIDTVCPICQYECEDKKSVVKLKTCNHYFHKECINNLINNDGKTCPICREDLYKCKKCNGIGNMLIYYEGAVLPIQYRGTTLRDETDGIYGIYNFYLEDLYINDLIYNQETNELFVSVQT